MFKISITLILMTLALAFCSQAPADSTKSVKVYLSDYQKARLQDLATTEKTINDNFKSATAQINAERTKIISLIIDSNKQDLAKVKSVEIDSTTLILQIIK